MSIENYYYYSIPLIFRTGPKICSFKQKFGLYILQAFRPNLSFLELCASKDDICRHPCPQELFIKKEMKTFSLALLLPAKGKVMGLGRLFPTMVFPSVQRIKDDKEVFVFSLACSAAS
jgi:hypothetical protein